MMMNFGHFDLMWTDVTAYHTAEVNMSAASLSVCGLSALCVTAQLRQPLSEHCWCLQMPLAACPNLCVCVCDKLEAVCWDAVCAQEAAEGRRLHYRV